MPANSNALLDQSRTLLQAHPVRGVQPRDLARVLAGAQLKRMDNGDVLCTEGEPGDAMFFLLDGSIKVTRTDPHGKVRELALIQAPAIVGHMALIDHSPRSATCTAGGRTVVASLERAAWSKMLHEPTQRGTALRRVLCASLTRQLVGANDRIRNLLGGGKPARPKVPSVPKPPTVPKAPPSRDMGHHSGALPTVVSANLDEVDEVDEFDASDSELMRVAGVLEGWRIDRSSLRAAETATFVFDDDQKRNRRNQN